MYIVVNHYSNENIGEFDEVNILPDTFSNEQAAYAYAAARLAEDVANRVERHTVPVSAEKCPFSLSMNIVCSIGEADEDFDRFHNIYAVVQLKEPV